VCCSIILASLLGWFVHPAAAVAIFIFMAAYYAATSKGIRAWKRGHQPQDRVAERRRSGHLDDG
jgi:hypothetical protein